MATKKQIEANRKNAQSSTGPQTHDGKAVVAQNAIKHGLTAQKPLIPGEDPAQFVIFNESMLEDLAPHGPLETVLANRIITLTWQLNRAPRIQAAAFKFMMKDIYQAPYDPEEHLGKTLVNDFANKHVLEKLQAYESRIESNLYKTIDKLEIIQKNRKNFQPQPEQAIHSQPTNHQLPTTNSFPQNKPNSQTETPPKISSRPEKCEGKSSVPQSANHELQTMNSVPQNKPNLNKLLINH